MDGDIRGRVASGKKVVKDKGCSLSKRRNLQGAWLQSQNKRLFRFFRSRISNASDIDDLVQETKIKIYKQLVDFDLRVECDEYCDAFVYRNAKNVLTDFLRKMRVRRYGSHTFLDDTDEDDWIMSGRAPLSDPEGELQMQCLHQQLMLRLDNLHERTRKIFLLHCLKGLGYRDISLAEGVSISCVEKHLRKAKDALKDLS